MNRRVDDARAIFDAAVRAVQADKLLDDENWDRIGGSKLASYGRIFVVGMGKASLALAAVLEPRLSRQIVDGVVVVPQGYPASLPGRLSSPSQIQVLEGGHPYPNHGSQRAAARILELARLSGEGDLLIQLISGGGSSLCAEFEGDISLEDAQDVYRRLLESGADIYAVNAVRKHLSRVSGGRLAVAASPADVLSLVVSDVVGDDLSVVSSGPTTGDPSTFEEAKRILEEKNIWMTVPDSVRNVIERGISDRTLETPKPGDLVFRRVTNYLLGTNKMALHAAAEEAERRGYASHIMATDQTGEARDLGRELGRSALKQSGERPICLIAGGEATVTIQGDGKGGRNQEMVLAAALEIQSEDRDIVFLSGGTDGIDGPTDAAGAWATPFTIPAAKKKGLDAHAYLQNNDSYTFFLHAGSILKTGHTHTNVMDVQLILVGGRPANTS